MEEQALQYATNLALVENGVVTNVIWGLVYNMQEFPGAVRVDDLAVQVGDTYDGERFYHDGAQVQSVIERLAAAETAIAELDEAVIELEYQNILLEMGVNEDAV